MDKTFRIFDLDCYCAEFDAKVLECQSDGKGGFAVVLDRTAFFPEMGGQLADSGTLDDANVSDARIKQGIIYHITDKELKVGDNVQGKIDFEARFRKMQNHTGEHIISGLAYKMYGANNVGFHLGHNDVTVDLDKDLSRDQLDALELAANRAVISCHPVNISFPSPDELKAMSYRSKIELTEDVRIVEIEGYDVCACCAPHVRNTGEIGLIKILDFIRYKGGVRLHLLCGLSALEDYKSRYFLEYSLSTSLSVPQDQLDKGFAKLQDQIAENQKKLYEYRQMLIKYKLSAIPEGLKNICLFENETDNIYLRNLANACVGKCSGVCAVFGGNPSDGYRYVITSGSVDLRAKSKDINQSINGRGGGSADMITGTCSATQKEIQTFIDSL